METPQRQRSPRNKGFYATDYTGSPSLMMDVTEFSLRHKSNIPLKHIIKEEQFKGEK
jgi:hypothetical protein